MDTKKVYLLLLSTSDNCTYSNTDVVATYKNKVDAESVMTFNNMVLELSNRFGPEEYIVMESELIESVPLPPQDIDKYKDSISYSQEHDSWGFIRPQDSSGKQ